MSAYKRRVEEVERNGRGGIDVPRLAGVGVRVAYVLWVRDCGSSRLSWIVLDLRDTAAGGLLNDTRRCLAPRAGGGRRARLSAAAGQSVAVAVALVPGLDSGHVGRGTLRAELAGLRLLELGQEGGLTEAGLVDRVAGHGCPAGGRTGRLSILQLGAGLGAGGQIRGQKGLPERQVRLEEDGGEDEEGKSLY